MITPIDDAIPAVEVLLGDGIVEFLHAALGTAPRTVRRRQVTWWPGRSIVAAIDVDVGDPDPLRLVAAAGRIPEGVGVLGSGDLRIGLWERKHDPRLEGLASALDPRRVEALVGSVGLAGPVELRLRAHRPLRRAVVEVSTPDARLFLKLVPPSRAAGLHESHRRLARVLPVPNSLGVDADLGIVVLEAVPGTTMRQTLDGGGRLPSADDLDRLLAAIPETDTEGGRSPLQRAAALHPLLRRLAPGRAALLDDTVAALGEEDPGADRVPIHGDLHDAQILLTDGRVTGVLDIDTHGWGHPADDPATLLGHLRSRMPHAGRPSSVERVASELEEQWSARLDAGELRRRSVAAMVALASGPFRVQSSDWADEVAGRIDRAAAELGFGERALIRGS